MTPEPADNSSFDTNAAINRRRIHDIEVSDIKVDKYERTPARIWLLIGLLTALTILTAFCANASSTSFALNLGAMLLLMTAIFAVTIYLVIHREAAKRDAILNIERTPCDRLDSVLAEHVPKLTFGRFTPLIKRVLRKLKAEERFGLAVRIGPSDELDDVTPIAVPFEPLTPQDVGDEPRARPAAPDADKHAPPGRLSALRNFFQPNSRVLDRAVSRIIIPAMVLLAVVNSLRSGQIDPLFNGLLIGLLIGVILRFLINSYRERQPLIVPGALIMREAGWRSGEWKLTVFDPRKSILLAYKTPRHDWSLVLHNQQHKYEFTVTRPQLTFILRAWLSPLDPPALEQLSDLK